MKIPIAVCSGLFLLLSYSAFAKDQEFKLEKSDAEKVELMCECKDWQGQAMTKNSDGVWTITLSLSPGTYAYKFLVNGSDWVFDPKNDKKKTVNGVDNSAVEVTDDKK